ncbi:MAG TPA: DUF1549 and DUF1553 domain-containing protein [Bryobacteraceae bacterium]|nr:DUF1549 and DUF1553 domain-containing protein [Bryobacteraceae bacterium]
MRSLLSRAACGALLLSVALCSLSAAEGARPFTAQQRKWWAFQKVTKPAVPAVKDPAWVHNPIDAFVLARLEAKGIKPNEPADKTTLLRRVTLDLTGLPPAPEDVQAFLSDVSPDAYEKLVDRLLASPHYGERWARHWLDLARYADSAGFKADETRPNIWRYRDYVISSFNSDKPYDRFVKEQIAGEELYPGDPAALVATGFSRHFPDESNARNLMQRRQELLNDVTDAVGATFLGLTYGCARCHDHKFDPILHKDYYRLQAFFANTRSEDEAPLLKPEEKADFDAKYAIWAEKTNDIRAEMKALAAPQVAAMYKDNFDKYPEEIQQAITTDPAKRTPFQWQMYHKSQWLLNVDQEDAAKKLKGDAGVRYKQLQIELAKFNAIKPQQMPVGQAMIDNGPASPKTHILGAGAYDAPLAEVQPGFLSILDPADAKVTPPPAVNSTGRRAALAGWLADPNNPLSTRVIVNRIWHYHFGRGLAGTPSDFGLMGERPTHPELLDYLTANFVENGWSIKKLHRQILLSGTYRQSSAYRKESAAVDPDDKLLWRFNRRRLEGESIRDSMLFASGLLNPKIGGPAVFPPLPAGVETRGGWKKNEEESETRRRSVYVFVRRNTRYPMFESFDMPDSHESCSRRSQSVTPSQSLELLNNELVLGWSRALAGRVLNDSGLTPEAQLDRAYKLAYARTPTAEERKAALAFLERHTPLLEARLAKNEKVPLPDQLPAGVPPARAAALVDLCHMLLNANEFLYLN